jgi:hypothetical protein
MASHGSRCHGRHTGNVRTHVHQAADRVFQSNQKKQFCNSTNAAITALQREPTADSPNGIYMLLSDYLALVYESGRIIRNNTRGAINGKLAPILNRIGLGRPAMADLDPAV